MIVFPLLTYYLWKFVRAKPQPDPKRARRISELTRRTESLEGMLEQVERDKTIPDEFKEELLVLNRRELARIRRLANEEGEDKTGALH